MAMFPSCTVSHKFCSLSEEASASSGNRVVQGFGGLNNVVSSFSAPQKPKKRRSLPDPDAEVIALSPKTLLATNRFVCEICKKGFQRDQNLQLHRRGHNLPWKLKQRNSKDTKKKAYVCPEPSCVHHHPSRALGDLTGIKKHYCRKHGEKKWKCDKCSKIYAVQSDWKAHTKICGTREYRCDCGTLFSRKDSFITHRAFCDALAEESARILSCASSSMSHLANPNPNSIIPLQNQSFILQDNDMVKPSSSSSPFMVKSPHLDPLAATSSSSAALSATALLQRAVALGAVVGGGGQTQSVGHHQNHHMTANEILGVNRHDEPSHVLGVGSTPWWVWCNVAEGCRLTRDFLGLTGHNHHGISRTDDSNLAHVSMSAEDALEYAGGVQFSLPFGNE
ncbi:PREDICTED: protein indeterminate-domain 12 isoform X2 [Tarenaya hassleriana]|uniref:protein indeterminate-domain 12 isoform X2 n=1 Tax=Tarenaya hassleriana TaxID=28532 RepID=UPI0008FD21EA|nr:PREDICTED: protein indeterminate-domain 12 isoform X2 [Tarenaya hassleriana]